MEEEQEKREHSHRQRMVRKKAVVDAGISRATREQGVLIVNTGNGKGKSSAAFGLIARALGHGLRVGVVQFIKGAQSTGEEAFFRRFPEVTFKVMGEGFTWETQDRARDVVTAGRAWDEAAAMLRDESYGLVVLDELNIALKHDYIDIADVITAMQQRPVLQHVVVTGRGAKQALLDIADTVTEMKEIKHAYKAGIKAQKGVEM